MSLNYLYKNGDVQTGEKGELDPSWGSSLHLWEDDSVCPRVSSADGNSWCCWSIAIGTAMILITEPQHQPCAALVRLPHSLKGNCPNLKPDQHCGSLWCHDMFFSSVFVGM